MKKTTPEEHGHAARIMQYMTEDQRQIFGSVRSIVNTSHFDADAGAELARLLLGVKRQHKPSLYEAVHQYAIDILGQSHLGRMRYTVDLVKDGEDAVDTPFLYPFPSFDYRPPIKRRIDQAARGRSKGWMASIGRSPGGIMHVERQLPIDDLFFDVLLVELATLSHEPFANIERLSLEMYGIAVREEVIEVTRTRWGTFGRDARRGPVSLRHFMIEAERQWKRYIDADDARAGAHVAIPGMGINPVHFEETLENLLMEWAAWRMGQIVRHHGFRGVRLPDDEQ